MSKTVEQRLQRTISRRLLRKMEKSTRLRKRREMLECEENGK